MHTQASTQTRFVFVRLDPGEDVLIALREAVRDQGITNGGILSGVGSLDRYHVHVVETTNMPPGNVFFRGEGPFDILSVTGLVVNGQVHAHISFSNSEQAMGGHLEEGCRILTFGAVVMTDSPDTALTGWDVRGPLAAPQTDRIG